MRATATNPMSPRSRPRKAPLATLLALCALAAGVQALAPAGASAVSSVGPCKPVAGFTDRWETHSGGPCILIPDSSGEGGLVVPFEAIEFSDYGPSESQGCARSCLPNDRNAGEIPNRDALHLGGGRGGVFKRFVDRVRGKGGPKAPSGGKAPERKPKPKGPSEEEHPEFGGWEVKPKPKPRLSAAECARLKMQMKSLQKLYKEAKDELEQATGGDPEVYEDLRKKAVARYIDSGPVTVRYKLDCLRLDVLL